jgi:integrase
MQLSTILSRYELEAREAGDVRRATKARVLQEHLGDVPLSAVTAGALRRFIKARQRAGIAPQTITHDINGLRAVLKVARVDYEIPGVPGTAELAAILEDVDLPVIDNARDRRLRAGEWDALVDASMDCRDHRRMFHAMTIAVETAMRRGELCGVTLRMVDLDARLLRLPASLTKTKKGRTLPLSRAATDVLAGRIATLRPSVAGADVPVMGLSVSALHEAWQRLRARAARRCPSVIDFHWHDFRHEALSRLAEKGWSLPQLQVISGHQDYRMLQRYVQLRPEDLVVKLDD